MVFFLMVTGLMAEASETRGLGWARPVRRQVAAVQPQVRVTRRVANLPSEEKTESSARDIRVDEPSGTGFAIFLGAGGGYFDVSASSRGNDFNRGGPSLIGKLNFAVHNERFIAELGLGWLMSRVTGKGLVVSGTTTGVSTSSVLTRAGMIDFSPRIRLGKFFDIGPMASVVIGQNANFTESRDNTPPVFVGAKTGLTFETKDLLFRLTATGGVSLTVPDRRIIYGIAALEIGIPIVRGKTVIRERETRVVRNHHERETLERETVLLREVEVPLLLMTLDDQLVNFEFDRAELKPESKLFLRKMGAFLAENEEGWGSLKIDGHTDSMGSDEYNDRLSKARAFAVRRELMQAGVSARSLISSGFGKNRPLDSAENGLAHARNRRVELSFSGVRDAQKIRDGVNRIRLAQAVPATCQGGVCR